jgi:tetratricopeptide (TPR) repeat protein
MYDFADQIRFSWAAWRHGRVIAFPGEPLPPEADLIAYAQSVGRPLLAVAEEFGAPVPLLLGILQSECRNLLESFLNHHDWGLDGRPEHCGDGYPASQIPLLTMGDVAQALRAAGCPGIEAVQAAISQCGSPAADVPLERVAGLLAAFYSMLPGAAAPLQTAARSLAPPPELSPEIYLAADPAYRAPVAAFLRLARGPLASGFRFILLHGSLATEDYLPGISDFDLFGIVRGDVASSAERLLRLREELLAVYPCLYSIDPQQHHGVMLCAEQDTLFYPQAFFPFTLFEHGRTAYARPGYSLAFAERDDRYERLHALYMVRQNYRWLASESWRPPSQFEAKFQVNLLLLAPALFFQQTRDYTYKKDSFSRLAGIFSPEELACLRQAEQTRAGNLYRTPVSWAESGGDAPLAFRVASFHHAVRRVPPSGELLDFLGPGFWVRAALFLELLVSGREGLRRLGDGAVDRFRWAHEPRQVPAAAYAEAAREMRAKLKSLGPELELWQFGDASHPGISDLDLLIEACDGIVPPELNALPAEFGLAKEDSAAAYVLQHMPSMIVRPHELRRIARYYPIFDVRRLGEDGRETEERIEFPDAPYAPDRLQALTGMACGYFFRHTLAPLLKGGIDVRQALLTTNGYRHSLRLLRANGVEPRGVEALVARVGRLRSAWFEMAGPERRRELLEILLQAVGAEVAIVDAIREALPQLVDCRAALEGFPEGALVAVLSDEVLFVQGWRPETALPEMLRIHGLTGRLKLVYPAEFAVLLAHLSGGEGIFQRALDSRFVHILGDPARFPAAPVVAERCWLLEDLYRFLEAAGLHWGGVPHWPFDPSAPATREAWQQDARYLLSDSPGLGIRAYVSRLEEVRDLVRQARGMVDAGDSQSPVPLLRKALAYSPQNPEALYLSGICSASNPAAAAETVGLLTAALEAGFDPVWVYLGRGQAYLQLRDEAAAEADIEAAAALDPAHPSVALMRQSIKDMKTAPLVSGLQRQIEAGEYAGAVQTARSVLAIDSANSVAYYLHAYALHALVAQSVRDAFGAYRLALEHDFDPFWVHYSRAQLHLACGDVEAAQGDIEAAASLKPDAPGIEAVRKLIQEARSTA